MDEDTKIELLVSGYMREFEKEYKERTDSLKIPDALTKIVIKFYQRSWRFMVRVEDKVEVSENRLKVTGEGNHCTALRYGPFFSLDENAQYQIKTTIQMGYSGYCGIGFITENFTGFDKTSYFNGTEKFKSEYWILYTNGYMPGSDMIRNDNERNVLRREWCDQWFEKCQQIVVKIDLQTMRALIWNLTELKKEDLSFDEYEKDNKYQHLVLLPTAKKVAIMVEQESYNPSIKILEQEFIFD